MHVMLKRAAASAVPVLLGLAVSPATAMAAPLPGPLHGGLAHGIIIHGHDEVLGNHVYANGGGGINNSAGATFGNGVVSVSGNSVKGRAAAHGRK